ncbi:hypothetical protein CP960_03235 [Malaciobacter halophilus]|uniref:Amine oxidase domain-containing protein n=1 Tax=Malaciobacter halophilus TaxID=197482 RepID=A0A2N1J4W8_9BACT|nr:NAD(P)-binding protein [Malaciobacter halophilus]AXH09615.1 putative NAD/FAD-dependent oxidoreductase [Malaciobacter halophilus]PKI81617.1 hypothetical protein CP960_03235 [Malaciobacter halophilus]
MNIAIIGAGLSGCVLYNNLIKKNHKITIFEKSRGTGGRLSTKYIHNRFCDHGTPYFETNNENFIKFCDNLIKKEILRKEKNRYIPTNGINKICSSLINKKDLKTETKIVACEYKNSKWCLKDSNNKTYDNFDILLLTIPSYQILELKIDLNPQIKRELKKVNYDSIFTMILHSNKNISLHKALKNTNIFKKIINNSNKYNYTDFSSFVLHSNEKFSNKNNTKTKEEIEKKLLNKLEKLNITFDKNFKIIPHLWKYAFAKNVLEKEFLYDEKQSLGVCGDYFLINNIEGAFLSSSKLSEYIKISIS